MMYKLFLSLDQLPESLNKKLRAHWGKKNRENKTWDMIISMNVSKRPKAPLSKAKLIIIRHSHRMLDFDGLVGSLKPVVDALVSAEILQDDSWGVLGAWQVDQRFRPKKDGPLLEILVQELPDKRN